MQDHSKEMAGVTSLLRAVLGFLCILESRGQADSSLHNTTYASVNSDVELIWTYQLGAGTTPLFESWKKLSETGIASRTIVDVYISSLYEGRVELFGQAGLRLKRVTLSDEGFYELFTVFSDGTSQKKNISVQVIDPCEDNDCAFGVAVCVPEGFNFTCRCNPGYDGDGKICVDIDECQDDSCPDVCAPGYTVSNGSCLDINECEWSPCANGGTCINVNGGYSCQCPPGYEGFNCDSACSPGEFAPDCTGTCHCADGDSVCDVMTGVCSSGGCEAGWKGSDCQTACSPGEFGPDCTGTCHCVSGDSVCDVMTGVCSSGGCEAGLEGNNCQTASVPTTRRTTAMPTGVPTTDNEQIATAIIPPWAATTNSEQRTIATTTYHPMTPQQTTAESRIFLQDNGVTTAIDGARAEFHWSYQLRSDIRIIFEAWWFKRNGDELIASRVYPLNASVSSQYKGRVEVFGDADLLLKAVSPADHGTYQLMAAFSDVSKSWWKDRHLVVNYPPTNMDVPLSLNAAEGDQVIIQAHANCAPPPTYLWTRINGSLPSNSATNMMTGTLMLLNVTLEDSGAYKVIASNDMGNSSDITIVSVKQSKAMIPPVGTSGLSTLHLVTIAVVPSVAILVLGVVAGILGYRWIRKRQSDKDLAEIGECTFHPDILESARDLHVQPLPLPPPVPIRPQFLKYEVNRTDLQLNEQIGRGAFGIVFLATLRRVVDGLPTEQTVVVKTVHEDAGEEEMKNFIREVDTTINLRQHINLLGLVGCCTVSHPPFLVTQYMPYGDLKGFLLKCRKLDERLRDSMYDFNEMNIYQVARQIANGMIYISQAGYVHGDLAARNVLVGEGLVVKIADFGLTTDIYQRGYQRQDGEQKIPVRWMAPERLMRESRYTSKSDVWSFGVVLYEIATLGNVPYPGRERTLLEELRTGYREPRPPGLQQDLYDMMLRCWQWDEDDRPEFQELYDELDAVVDSMATDYAKPRPSSPEAAEAPESSYDIPKSSRIKLQQLNVTRDVHDSEYHDEIEMDSLTQSSSEESMASSDSVNDVHESSYNIPTAVECKAGQQPDTLCSVSKSDDNDLLQMESFSLLRIVVMNTKEDSFITSALSESSNVQENDTPTAIEEIFGEHNDAVYEVMTHPTTDEIVHKL